MKKIAIKLMEWGVSFNYENHNSNGEEIICIDMSIEIKTYQGQLFFEFEGDKEELEETEKNFTYLCDMIEKIMIAETSSF
ncbi:hypothetical protein ACM55G_14615 [Flavobacterium sp. LB3P122]|uniref:hypothetical protein n=1 Tax=Flavobacterium algoriphilum TaxID=3398738 RepID=UPI003A84A158